MTRVLQAMAGAAMGGAEAFFERLVPALARAGVEQRAIIRDNPRRAELLTAAGVPVIQAPFGGRLDMRTGWLFRRALRDFKPQIVLTWMNRASRFCPKSRGVVQVGRLGGYYDLKYYRHADHLIGNTRDIVEWMVAQGWPAERAHYLPNFVSDNPAKPYNRKEFWVPDNGKIILGLGRLHENKGFDVLLRALVQLPSAYLLLAGEGPLRQELEKLAQKLGVKPRVRFLGWRDDVAALYATADLFVCPSRHEPLGNVVIEAWAQGRPVVATASQGPSALIRDGETGLLTPVDDAAALAQAMGRVLSDAEVAARLGAAGRAAFEAEFTEQAVVEQYKAFFDRIAAECVA